VAGGAVYDRPRIQAHLPADTALLAWLDLKALPRAADPNGEHWACLLRHRGEPVWVKLPGSGPANAWTEGDDQLPRRVRQALVGQPPVAWGDWQRLVARLHAQRLAPLEQALRAQADGVAVQHLVVLPSPGLADVPVEVLTDRYTVSYAPSGTLFAWLREKGRGAADRDRPAEAPRLLAVGDPVMAPPEGPPAPEPPAHGLLLAAVAPGSPAAGAGLRPNDVLLTYGGMPLSSPQQLTAAVGRQRGPAGIPVTLWRNGQTLARTVPPGRLGVRLSDRQAAEAIRERRQADQMLRAARGPVFPPLPGTRAEVQAIAGCFARPLTLLGSEASEQNLTRLAASGELGGSASYTWPRTGCSTPTCRCARP
jgi:hypothetical protein